VNVLQLPLQAPTSAAAATNAAAAATAATNAAAAELLLLLPLPTMLLLQPVKSLLSCLQRICPYCGSCHTYKLVHAQCLFLTTAVEVMQSLHLQALAHAAATQSLLQAVHTPQFCHCTALSRLIAVAA
jgi:hypothetical protein